VSSTAGEVGVPGLTQEAMRRAPRSLWRDGFSRLLANKLALFGLVVIVLLLLGAIFADVLSPYNPTQTSSDRLQTPSLQHPMGTDPLGRDVFSRILHGARVSLAVGLMVQLLYLAIGVPFGAIAAFAGGKLDNGMMRFVDVLYAFPDLIFIILIRSLFGAQSGVMGVVIVVLAIGLVNWLGVARLTRGQILTLRERDFVTAAKAVGSKDGSIISKHLVPNALGALIIAAAFGIPAAIFAEAALSFLGVGVTPPLASWGTMINDGYANGAIFSYPYLVLFPALAVMITMLAFTFVGDGLRDALDPRTRKV
jgi:oligopeptide transport system permease protein